jgi:predicted dithiol-disulfide oxidoreductase (DUF899 family)
MENTNVASAKPAVVSAEEWQQARDELLRADRVLQEAERLDTAGVDRLVFTNHLLDHTPYGRQEDWEDSPPGWPQHPTYG